jgi:hypothetical protein
MSTDLVLRRTETGVSLNRTNVARALGEICTDGLKCGLSDDKLSIRIGVSLAVTDPRCSGIEVSFTSGGRKLTGTTRRGGGPLLYWCLHALAARLGCELFDPQEGKLVAPNSEQFLAAAKAQVTANESDLLADEPYVEPPDTAASSEGTDGSQLLIGFLDSLIAAEQLSLTGAVTDLGQLASQLDEPSELYETLLDSPLVDEVFVSESQFVHSLAAYRRSR